MEHSHHIIVEETEAGVRLDKFLASKLEDISRSRVQQLIVSGFVSTPSKNVTDQSIIVSEGDTYIVTVPPPEPTEMRATDIPLDIVFEDDQLLVINKPVGLTTHPGAGNHQDTLANALLHHCGDSLSGIGGVSRPGIVHRLDKDTSGLMVAAKTDKAHQSLSGQIQSRELKRTYMAIVWGIPFPPSGTVDGNIDRHPRNRKKMAVVKEGGKTAMTHYKVKAAFQTFASELECRLETGRTHQIRVHMSHLGNPIIGDQSYGRSSNNHLRSMPKDARDELRKFQRQALHSKSIAFEHPITKEILSFEVPPPDDLKALISLLRSLQF